MYPKHFLSLLFLSCAWLVSAAQIKFVDGYIVTNDHKKTVCQIRNIKNPESLTDYEYRLNEDKQIKKIELSKIEEFGIANKLKCVRALIKIDVSPDRITHLRDTIKSPEWEEGHAYLSVLVHGRSASLYSYYYEGTNTYFFSVGNSAIEPLFYKEFRLEITPGIVECKLINKAYQQQLKQYLACDKTEDTGKVSYTKKDLMKYFTSFELCDDSVYLIPENTKSGRNSLRFKIGTSINNIKMESEDYVIASKITFSHENSVGYTAEVEYLLSLYTYKWSFFAESNFYTYNTVYSKNTFNSSHDGYSVDYKTLELPLGINYYMNITSNQRAFIRGAFVPHYILNGSNINYNIPVSDGFAPSSRMMFGAGYNYRRLSAEMRFYSGQNLTQNLNRRGSNLSQLSFRLTYIIIKSGK